MEETEKIAPIGTKKKGLSGAVLKWIAVVTMFLDHSAVMVFTTWLIPVRHAMGSYPLLTPTERTLYHILRCVGRPAFPVYCFLLVEGFVHTRDIKKYLGRLLVFGLVSELPFDYALFGGITWSYQNVYFTLFLGLLAVWGISRIRGEDFASQSLWARLGRALGCAAVSGGCLAAAELLYTDYGWTGVALILLLYLFRQREVLRDISAGLTVLSAGIIEAVSWIDFLLFHFYNGERGRQSKYFFYAFYPGHLLLLWLIRRLVVGT